MWTTQQYLFSLTGLAFFPYQPLTVIFINTKYSSVPHLQSVPPSTICALSLHRSFLHRKSHRIIWYVSISVPFPVNITGLRFIRTVLSARVFFGFQAVFSCIDAAHLLAFIASGQEMAPMPIQGYEEYWHYPHRSIHLCANVAQSWIDGWKWHCTTKLVSNFFHKLPTFFQVVILLHISVTTVRVFSVIHSNWTPCQWACGLLLCNSLKSVTLVFISYVCKFFFFYYVLSILFFFKFVYST